MSAPTYAVSTELDAVNQILSSVGQAPVTTLDQENPEVAIVLTTLREINKQVQAEGWIFNTERNYKFTPDSTTKEIQLPTNVIQLDVNTQTHLGSYDAVRRNGKLYDRLNHTFQWNEVISADVVWYLSFTDLPTAFQNYITARAAVMCATKMVGDRELYTLLAKQEESTRATVIEYECNQGDYTMFGFRDGENYYNSYQPFRALMR